MVLAVTDLLEEAADGDPTLVRGPKGGGSCYLSRAGEQTCLNELIPLVQRNDY